MFLELEVVEVCDEIQQLVTVAWTPVVSVKDGGVQRQSSTSARGCIIMRCMFLKKQLYLKIRVKYTLIIV